MKRTKVQHSITYPATHTIPKYITSVQWTERKIWCRDRLGASMPGGRWWAQRTNIHYVLQFSYMEDVTMYLLAWDF